MYTNLEAEQTRTRPSPAPAGRNYERNDITTNDPKTPIRDLAKLKLLLATNEHTGEKRERGCRVQRRLRQRQRMTKSVSAWQRP